MIRKPCPRHPELGDLLWMEVQWTDILGEVKRDVLCACTHCLLGSKPYERPEFAS